MELLNNPETWVAAAFLILLGLLLWLGAHRFILSALDDRSARIRSQLDEALKLRKEAESVLSEYKLRQEEAEKTAASIVHNASLEADRIAAEAAAKVEEFIARRTRMAETKIAQAEAQAVADVRSAAADVAVAAAEDMLAGSTKGAAGDALVAQGIADLKSRLN